MKTSATSETVPAAAPSGAASPAGGDRPGRKPGPAPRPQTPPPSREAKQRAAAILEVLAGGRTPAEAAGALAVSLSRYYLLEARALQGLLAACAPAPRGPGPDERRALAALRAECERWKRECARQQALVRAAQRTIGLTAPAPPARAGRKRKPKKPVARALQAAARLQQEAAAAAASTEASLQS